MRARVHTSSTLPIAFLLLNHSCLRNGSAQLMPPCPVDKFGSSGCNAWSLMSLSAKAAGSLGTPQGLNPGHTCKHKIDRTVIKANTSDLLVSTGGSQRATALGPGQAPLFQNVALMGASRSIGLQRVKSHYVALCLTTLIASSVHHPRYRLRFLTCSCS